jgi:hypothetical protein
MLRYSPRDILDIIRRPNVNIMRINEIDLWLNGKGSLNFREIPIPFRAGVTVPGYAPRGYGPTVGSLDVQNV